MSITSKVSSLETEVHQLRIQNESLTSSNALLEEALHRAQTDLMLCSHERDEARRAVAEVTSLIEGIGKISIEGITKIRASKTPLTREVKSPIEGHTASVLAAPEYP